jgi:hypothetical protein
MQKLSILCALIFVLFAPCSRGAAQQPSGAQPENQNAAYENQYMKVVLQPGWAAKKPRRTLSAVNITRGNYILYISTQATQASGAEGGRFSEIAMGAPSADAVVTVQPSPPCGKAESTPVLHPYTRVDLYVSQADSKSQEWCNAPSSGATVWYFSYITDAAGGFLNHYVPGQGPALVITMAYRSKDVNSLPIKGSTELNSALAEMTAMVNSLKVKRANNK